MDGISKQSAGKNLCARANGVFALLERDVRISDDDVVQRLAELTLFHMCQD